MRKIKFTVNMIPKHKEWIKKCQKAKKNLHKLVKKGGKWSLNRELYEILKHIYSDPTGPFYSRCAYCERRSDNLEVEHYRPAKEVRKLDNTLVKRKRPDNDWEKHPGYYWEAYNWLNLLPSCNECNAKRKKNKFPVESDDYAWKEKEQQYERPLLLNPLLDDVESHMYWDEKAKQLLPSTKKGQISFEVLGFGIREQLMSDHREAYEKVSGEIARLISANRHNMNLLRNKLNSLSENIESGNWQYSFVSKEAFSNIAKAFSK